MKILQVNYFNIDIIYNFLKSLKDNEDYKNYIFMSNIVKLYENASVSFVIDDISLFEYYIMKLKYRYITEFNRNSNIIFDDKDNELDKLCKQYIARYKNPNNLPVFYIKGNCTVTLTGCDLIDSSLLGIDPRVLFKSISNNYDLEDIYEVTDKLGSIFVNGFINGFYKYFMDTCTYIDLLSDYGIEKTILSYGKENTAIPLSIKTPFFTTSFVNDDLTNLSDKFKIFKEKNTYDSLTNIYFEFVINTNLYEFLNQANLLPTRCIISTDNFNTLLKEENIEYNKNKNVNTGKNSKESIEIEILKNVVENLSDKSDLVRRFCYLSGKTKIKYMIRITVDDVNKYLIPNEADHPIFTKIIDLVSGIYRAMT